MVFAFTLVIVLTLKTNSHMERSTLEKNMQLASKFYRQNDDERRELIYLISVLLKEYGGSIKFHTQKDYDEEDLTMVLTMNEFGYESHTYVVEELTLDERDRVNVKLHRYNYTGFGEYQTITLWYLSVDELIKIYQEMTNLIEEEMEEEKHEEE